MRAKLLKILRRDAEKWISIEYKHYEECNVGCVFIIRKGKERVYEKYAISMYMKGRHKEDMFKRANELRREYILEKLAKLK